MVDTNNVTSHLSGEIMFTWKPDKNPSSFISYDITDNNSDENNSFSYEFQKENLLLLARDEGDVEPNDKCILQLSCCPNSINGITVISESRTLEISNNTDGYIGTIRGKDISKLKDSPNDGCILYLCKHHFNESYTNLNVKFLSLGEQTSFCLHSLVVNISQHSENNPLHIKGTFDINKLKKDVDAMGDAVSDRAKELLTTMEQFKQNKLRNIEDLMAFEQHAKKQSLSSPVQDLSSMMNSVLQAGALKSLLGESQIGREGTDAKGPDIYRMLQAVCGSVSSMRTVEKSKVDQHLNAIASPDSGLDSTPHDTDEKHVHIDELIIFVEQKINQVKSELQTEFTELKREVSLQINIATSEMNGKLDKIINMLQDIQGKKEESAPKSKTYQDYL